MNFPSYSGPFPTSIQNIHQFATWSASSSLPLSNDTSDERYNSLGNDIPHFNQQQMPKLRPDGSVASNDILNTGGKYTSNSSSINSQFITNIPSYAPPPSTACFPISHQLNNIDDKINRITSSTYQAIQNINTSSNLHQAPSQCSVLPSQQSDTKKMLSNVNSGWQSLTPSSTVADYLSHLPGSTLPLSLHHFLKYSAENIKKESIEQINQNACSSLNLNSLSSSLLSATNILNQALPSTQTSNNNESQQQEIQDTFDINTPCSTSINAIQSVNCVYKSKNLPTETVVAASVVHLKPKKKKKKRQIKEKKIQQKPGEIHLTTALDGSTLYCCPECQMAYPEKSLLDQHLVGHKLERRFICDICNAALKRKDHLTRHKQSHNPERPYVCNVCMKAFKRKEQLSLHFVIHSGEKRHICSECGKGFYRKDHLRKHTRSHIARRLKSELNQEIPSSNLLAAQRLQQDLDI